MSILITGTNRGIGLEFVKHYLKNNEKVIATCRNRNSAKDLLELKNTTSNLSLLELDVSKPQSRESVKLASANPNDRPQISLNLLKDENDLKMMIAGQKFFLDAFQTGPLGKKVKQILIPDVKNLDDQKLAVHCKKFVKTNYHPSGTAKMGADSDKMAVLDAKMRVRGVENLRVSDLSAVPNINSGNTSAPAMMLGLRCGDLISNS